MGLEQKKRVGFIFLVLILLTLYAFMFQVWELALALMFTTVFGIIHIVYFTKSDYRDKHLTTLLTIAGILFVIGGFVYLQNGDNGNALVALIAGFTSLLPITNDYVVEDDG